MLQAHRNLKKKHSLSSAAQGSPHDCLEVLSVIVQFQLVSARLVVLLASQSRRSVITDDGLGNGHKEDLSVDPDTVSIWCRSSDEASLFAPYSMQR